MENLLLLIIAIVAAALIGVQNIFRSIAATRWRTTEGNLLKWNMEIDGDSDGDLVVNELIYTYKVNGKEFQSDRVGFGYPKKSGYSHSAMDDVLSESPKVNVYFNEANPKLSTLIVGFKQYHAFKLMIYGFIMLGVFEVLK